MDKTTLALGIALIALIVAIAGLGDITGFAVAPGLGGGKTEHTSCARECTLMCIDGAELPASNVEELSVDDWINVCSKLM